jgi:hypothetical protein
MPVGSLLPQLLESGQVPEDILAQMESARDPAMGFSQSQPPMQPQSVNPQNAPRMSEFEAGAMNPTYADLFKDNPAMGYAYLRSKGFPQHLYLNQVPLQGDDRKRFEDTEKRRFDYWRSQKDVEATQLAREREIRLEREGRAREKAADARTTRLEEGRPLTTVELRDVRTDLGNMDAAELALKLLEGKNVKGMVGDRAATGWKGFISDVILQRADPMGVDTRAALSNIGSLRAQERSGGAIPAHEWERIKGFIPTDTDSPVTARKKLRQFITEYQRALNNALATFEGRKVPPKLRQEMERRGRPSLEELLGGGG